MSRRLFARLPFLLILLPVSLSSLLGRVSTSLFDPLLYSAQTDFHVQLLHRCLTSVWESFFSSIDPALISKSCSSALLRSA